MEDKQPDQHIQRPVVPTPPRSGVMDIQPRRAPQPTPPPPQPQPQPIVSPASPQQPVVPPVPPTPPVEVTAPTPPAPSVEQIAPVAASSAPRASGGLPAPGLTPELLAQATAETSKPDQKPADGKKDRLLSAHAPRRSRGPSVAIAIAVVIATALAGIAAYAFVQSRNKDSTNTPAPATEHQDMDHSSEEPQTTQRATTDEVEAAARELESTINATDEAKELPDSGISESSLGL